MELDDGGAVAPPPLTRTAIGPDESVVVTAVRAVAAVANVAVTNLPPLGDALDPDALEEIASASAFTGTITFAYDGYVVRVEAGESVAVHGDAPGA